MKFGEKVRIARKKSKMTQQELANELGVSLRTITGYETEGLYPRKREIYTKLANIFNCEESYFKSEEDEFVLQANEEYGDLGKRQALSLVSQMTGLFSGGALNDEDKDAVMKALMDAYWLSKKENSKYSKKD